MRLRRVYGTGTYFYSSAYACPNLMTAVGLLLWQHLTCSIHQCLPVPDRLERKQRLHDLMRDALRLLPSIVASLVSVLAVAQAWI